MIEYPLVYIRGLEPKMTADLQVRNSSLADESSDETLADAESLGDLTDVDQLVIRALHKLSTGTVPCTRGN